MKDYRTPFALLLLAATLITLFSCCSWIYPLQPYDDANWFMSIGKSMLRGKLLYTDLHDQKGPLLFFLHEWAAALSSHSFIGIYIVEVLCCFAFLLLSYRTMRLFAVHRVSLLTTCLVGVLTYSSDFMCYGDTVEELALPVLLFVLLKALRYAMQGRLPGCRESFVMGMALATVFWMKFTVLAMCGGAFVALFILAWQRKEMLLLLQSLTWVLAGFGLLTACVLLYFVLHGNEADLYHSYFWFNMFTYANAGKVDSSAAWWPAKWGGWLLLVGGAACPKRVRPDVKIAVTLCWGMALLPFVIFKVYLYYFFTVFAFAPLLICFTRNVRLRLLLFLSSFVVLLALCTNWNLMTLLSGCFPQAILPLAETVNTDHDPDKQVLTVKSYDTGIYTLTDCLPPIKYFSTPNAYVEELVREQTAYLKSCQAKYLIQKSGDASKYYDSFHPDLERDYTLIQEASNAYRTEFLLHPLEFLWSLGYMRGFIERFHTPEGRRVVYRLWQLSGSEVSTHDPQYLIGEWESVCPDGSRCTLSFSAHGIVRYRCYRYDEPTTSKYYSYILRGDSLRLGYMETGDEYKTVSIAGHSVTRLVLRGWPERGLTQWIKK